METTDYLNKRTTNVNIRVSPALKSLLIQEGAKLGLNLSDFIYHSLTLTMSSEKPICEECPKLEDAILELSSTQVSLEEKISLLSETANNLKKEIENYEDLISPYEDALKTGIKFRGEVFHPKSKFELMKLFFNNKNSQNND